jgi:hypothetical protein
MSGKMCVLEENKVCNKCGCCLYCDIEPNKLCTNCCKCLDLDDQPDFKAIEISEIILNRSDDTEFFEKETSRRQKRQYRFRIVLKDKSD